MPSQLSQNAVIATMQLVTSRWSQMCNIEFRYMGLSTAQPLATVGSNQDQINVLSWGRFAGGMTGIAAYAAVNIITSAGVSTLEDVDIILNNEMVTDITTLDGVLMHEVGHAIGIGHSDKQAAIMSASPYYGAASNQQTNRVLNWAESAYPNLLGPKALPTQGYDGYIYRHYLQTGNYAASKNGRAYFMGTDGVIHDLGPLAPYTAQAIAAGY